MNYVHQTLTSVRVDFSFF